MAPLSWRHVVRPTTSHVPGCREAIWELPLPDQGQIDASSYLNFALRLSREQNPYTQLVTDLIGVHVVRRQRTRRLVVPVPAQRHRDGCTGSRLVRLRLHDEERLVDECLFHTTSVVEDPAKRHSTAAGGSIGVVLALGIPLSWLLRVAHCRGTRPAPHSRKGRLPQEARRPPRPVIGGMSEALRVQSLVRDSGTGVASQGQDLHTLEPDIGAPVSEVVSSEAEGVTELDQHVE